MQLAASMKGLAVAALLAGLPALAADLDTHLALEASHPAKCDCKNAGECTCPKGECKCKNCGNGRKLFEPLKGASESTRLPATARHDDARAGVLI